MVGWRRHSGEPGEVDDASLQPVHHRHNANPWKSGNVCPNIVVMLLLVLLLLLWLLCAEMPSWPAGRWRGIPQNSDLCIVGTKSRSAQPTCHPFP